MAAFVVDASAALACWFRDKSTDWTVALLARWSTDESAVVPAHWSMECLNALAVALRRGRIHLTEATEILEVFEILPTERETAPLPEEAMSILSLSENHQLTAYDAAYLELARRKRLPLATLDKQLRHAATVEGVVLL